MTDAEPAVKVILPVLSVVLGLVLADTWSVFPFWVIVNQVPVFVADQEPALVVTVNAEVVPAEEMSVIAVGLMDRETGAPSWVRVKVFVNMVCDCWKTTTK